MTSKKELAAQEDVVKHEHGMEQFFTRKRANSGVLMPPHLPDGTPHEAYWLRVRSIDSDEFRAAELAGKRAIIGAGEDLVAREKAIDEAKSNCALALIADWNFPEAFTKENVSEFLKEAPQVLEQLNEFAGDRAKYYAKK